MTLWGELASPEGSCTHVSEGRARGPETRAAPRLQPEAPRPPARRLDPEGAETTLGRAPAGETSLRPPLQSYVLRSVCQGRVPGRRRGAMGVIGWICY